MRNIEPIQALYDIAVRDAERLHPPVANAPTAILGIDPGLSGALAYYDPARSILDVVDMPTFKIKGGNALDEVEVARLIDNWSAGIREVWIEQMWMRPTDGQANAIKLLSTYFIPRGICIANFLKVNTVSPQAWKRKMGVTADKRTSLNRASELMPTHAHEWKRLKDNGRAEAALIAHYGHSK